MAFQACLPKHSRRDWSSGVVRGAGRLFPTFGRKIPRGGCYRRGAREGLCFQPTKFVCSKSVSSKSPSRGETGRFFLFLFDFAISLLLLYFLLFIVLLIFVITTYFTVCLLLLDFVYCFLTDWGSSWCRWGALKLRFVQWTPVKLQLAFVKL